VTERASTAASIPSTIPQFRPRGHYVETLELRRPEARHAVAGLSFREPSSREHDDVYRIELEAGSVKVRIASPPDDFAVEVDLIQVTVGILVNVTASAPTEPKSC
jgi:hypothetical protein